MLPIFFIFWVNRGLKTFGTLPKQIVLNFDAALIDELIKSFGFVFKYSPTGFFKLLLVKHSIIYIAL